MEESFRFEQNRPVEDNVVEKVNEEFIRIQLKHNYYPESNPYSKELEDEIIKLNLPIIGSTEKDTQEAIIRHETEPEIILLLQ